MAFLRRALLLALMAAPACFSPRTPPCAFSCADDGLCPAGYTCQSDGVCHRDDHQGICDIPSQIDAGADAPDDAGDAVDATDDAGD